MRSAAGKNTWSILKLREELVREAQTASVDPALRNVSLPKGWGTRYESPLLNSTQSADSQAKSVLSHEKFISGAGNVTQ